MDKITKLYQASQKRGILTNGLTEEMFRQQLQEEGGADNFYEIATRRGVKLGDKDTYINAIKSAFNPAASAPVQPTNPSVAANPAQTTEAEYQANLQKQWQGEPTLEELNKSASPYAGMTDEQLREAERAAIERGNAYSRQQAEKAKKEYENRGLGRRILDAISESQQLDRQGMTSRQAYEQSVADNPELAYDAKTIEELASIRNELGRRAASAGFGEQIAAVQQDKDRISQLREGGKGDANLASADYMLTKASEILNAPSRFDKTNGFANFFRGAGNDLFDRQFFATVDLQRNIRLANIVKKLNGGTELSPTEQEMLDAYVTLSEAQQARANDLSLGYEIGQGAAKSAPFMLDMVLGASLSGAGKRALVRRIAKKVNKDVAAKWARRIVGAEGVMVDGELLGSAENIGGKEVGRYLAREAVETPLQAMTMPSSWANIVGDKVDNMLATKRTDWDFKDFMRSATNMYVETLTERAGGKLIDMGLGKILPFGKIWTKKAGAVRLANDYVQSPISETLEEYLGAGINTIRSLNPLYSNESNEQLRGEAKEMFTGEGFLKTFGTVLPMSLLGGAKNMAGVWHNTYKYNQSRDNLKALLSSKGATDEEAENILSVIEGAESPEEFYGYMNKSYENLINLGVDEKTAEDVLMDYVKNAMQYNASVQELNNDFSKLSQDQQEQAKAEMAAAIDKMQSANKVAEEAKSQLDANSTYDPITNKQNGYIYHARQAGDEQSDLHIINGNVVTTTGADGRVIIDKVSSDEKLTVVDAEGHVTLVAPDELELIEAPVAAYEAKAAYMERANQINDIKPGDSVVVNGESSIIKGKTDEGIVIDVMGTDGQAVEKTIPFETVLRDMTLIKSEDQKPVVITNGSTIRVQGLDNGNGTYSVTTTNGITNVLNQEQMQEMGLRIEDQQQEDEPQNEIDTFALPDGTTVQLRRKSDDKWETLTQDELGSMEYTAEDIREIGMKKVDKTSQSLSQPTQQPTGNANEPANATSYPVDENGEPAWGQMQPEQSAQVIVDAMGRASAKDYVELKKSEASKAVKDVSRLKPRSTSFAAFQQEDAQIKQQQKAANDLQSYWNNVSLAIASIKTEAERQAEEEQRQKMMQAREERSKTTEGKVENQSMAERYAAAPKIIGNEGTITLPDGRELKGRYILTTPDAATASHDARSNFAMSSGYPVTEDGQSINDRDYTNDPEEQQKVIGIATNYNGNAIKNMPVVSDEGLVYNGNGRWMAGQLAAANGTDGAYTQSLMNNAGQFGFTAEQVQSIPNARVAFQLDERLPYNTSSLAIFNEQETQTQSNTGKAAAYARKLTPQAISDIVDAISGFNTRDAFFNDSKAPFELINRLIADGIIGEREKAEMVDGDKLSALGRERLENIMLGTVFSNETIRLMGDDAGLKNSILRALPQIIDNKSLGEYSLEQDINDAIRLLYEVRNSKMPFRAFVSQTIIAEDGQVRTAADNYSPFQLLLAERMTDGGVDAFRDVLTSYNNKAKQVQGGQIDIFGGLTSTEELKQLVLNSYGKKESTNEGANTGSETQSVAPSPQQSNGQETESNQSAERLDRQGNPIDEQGNLVVEELLSIDDLKDEDFDNPKRNVALPELPSNIASSLGINGRPVIIKKNIFEKNSQNHPELDPADSRLVLYRALYQTNLYGNNQSNRPNYRVAIQTSEDDNSVVVLDIYQTKSKVEIVGWRKINDKGLDRMKRQSEREDEQLLILSPIEGSAAALSTLPSESLGNVTERKGTTKNSNTQISGQENAENLQNDTQTIQQAAAEAEKEQAALENSPKIQGMDYTVAEVEDMTGRMIRNILDENGYEGVEIVGVKVIGSRTRNEAREDSDLDVLVEYKGDATEDGLFNLINGENKIVLDGVEVDVNPITRGKSGTIEQFMKRSDAYIAEQKAAQLAQAEAETDTNPTEAQKKAGNYKMGHVKLFGFDVTVENPAGSVRRGTDQDGKEWEQTMNNTYGYIRGTEGVDGDHIDVFIGPNLQSDKVFIVDQLDTKTREFDEHKCLLGFDSMEEAQDAYLSNYEEGWTGMGPVSETTLDEFRKWIDSSHRKTKPFNEYKSVKVDAAQSAPATLDGLKRSYPKITVENVKEFANSVVGIVGKDLPLSEYDKVLNSYVQNGSIDPRAILMFYDAVKPTTPQTPLEAAKANKRSKEETAIRKEITDLGNKLGVSVHIADKVEDIPDASVVEALNRGTAVDAWYNVSDGSVWFYMPNVKDVATVRKNIMHEIVAHKGLRQLLGTEQHREVMLKVWDSMPDADKSQFANYVLQSISSTNLVKMFPDIKTRSWDKLTDEQKQSWMDNEQIRTWAADEFVANAAENLDDMLESGKINQTLWQKICDFIREAVEKVMGAVQLTNDDIRDLLRASRDYLMQEAKTRAENENKTISQVAKEAVEKQKKTPKRIGDAGQRKIDDYGEKIAGARKDALKELAKSFDDATVQSLVALPFSKAFKRPDVERLVKNGVIRDTDAVYVEAILNGLLSTPKPKDSRRTRYLTNRGKDPIEKWANDTRASIELLQQFVNATEQERDELVRAIEEDNPVTNPVTFLSRVLRLSGYEAGEKVKMEYNHLSSLSSEVVYVETPTNKYNHYLTGESVEDAIKKYATALRLQKGELALDIPDKWLRTKAGKQDRVETGRYIVTSVRKGSYNFKETVFKDKQSAEEAEKKYKDAGYDASIRPETTWGEKHDIQIGMIDPLTGDEFFYDKKYPNQAAANQALEDERDEYLSAILKQSAEAKGIDTSKRGNLHINVQYVYEGRDMKGYCVMSVYSEKDNYAERVSPMFETKEEAQAYLNEHRSEIEDEYKRIKDFINNKDFFAPNKPRQGEDYRQGKNITEKELAATFGFRGIQFGNWTNNDDRQQALNQTYDALLDLCKVIGLSPRALSLNGELGIAFGSRGSGSANAHYEPTNVVINLTKTRGAGSLAHEWLHALDNYFARQNNVPLGMVSQSNISGMRPELKAAWDELMDDIRTSNFGKRSKERGEYWGSPWEEIARLFAEYINDSLEAEGMSNHFLSRGIEPSVFDFYRKTNYGIYKGKLKSQIDYRTGKPKEPMSYEEFIKTPDALRHMPYPTKEETAAFAPKIRNLFETIQEKVDEDSKNVVLFSIGNRGTVRVPKDATPLEQARIRRNAAKRADIQDEEYREAIRRGDMQTAHELVVKAAKKAMPDTDEAFLDKNGNHKLFYHNTPNTFTIFNAKFNGKHNDAGWLGDGFYFYGIEGEGWSYGKNKMLVFLNITNPYYASNEEMERLAELNSREESIKFRKRLEEDGYDGVYFNGDLREEAVAFYPSQIKSADDVTYTNEGAIIPPSKRFDRENDDIRFHIANQNNAIFVSNAEKAVREIKQDKATPKQWLAMIEKNGGMKAGEDKWLGLSEWLKASDAKTITKDDILKFIAENRIEIEETHYAQTDEQEVFRKYKDEFYTYYHEAEDAGENDPGDVAWQRMIDEYGDDFDMGFYAYGDQLQWDEDNDYVQWMIENEGFPLPINRTRLDYTTEGLENKHEIALTVPTIEPWNENDDVHFGDAGQGRAVAWIRFGDTTNEDGDNVLVIDEIQSKRHQEGREKGYRKERGRTREQIVGEIYQSEKTLKDYNDSLRDKYGTYSWANERMTQEERDERNRLQINLNELKFELSEYDSGNDFIPAAPFEKNWMELAFKRMIRYAAENGYDRIAWTTGEQQAERYDIGQIIDYVSVDDWQTYPAWKYQGQMKHVILNQKGGGEMDFLVDKDGKVWGSSSTIIKDETNLGDAVGKELATKIMEGGAHEFGQDDLRIGAEGMAGFYDRMLPEFVKKYTKKWGARVEDVELPNIDMTMHSVNVTPEMKESAMQGQVMFHIANDNDSRQLVNDAIDEALDNAGIEVVRAEEPTEDAEAEYMAAVNDRFNEELQKQIDGTQEKGYVYQLGQASQTLVDAGIADLPIELAASRLVDKSMQENHPFDISEIKNLPQAIQNPMAVMVSATKTGSHLILTELTHGNKNYVVAVRVNINRGKIEVNDIRSIHYRDGMNIVNLISEGLGTHFRPDMVEWITKIENELRSKPQYNSAEVRAKLKSAAKIIQNYVTTKFLGEKMQNFSEMGENAEYFRTPNGIVYGWAKDGKIYLTEDGLNPNTKIHEYTHLWAKAMQQRNPEGWQSVVDNFKGTPMWEEVVNDPNYQNLQSDDDICSEALARFSGSRGAERMQEIADEMQYEAKQSGLLKNVARTAALLQRVKKALSNFWKWVSQDLFGIKQFTSPEEVADRVLYDLVSSTKLGEVKGEDAEMMVITPLQEALATLEERIGTAKEEYQTMNSVILEASINYYRQERDKLNKVKNDVTATEGMQEEQDVRALQAKLHLDRVVSVRLNRAIQAIRSRHEYDSSLVHEVAGLVNLLNRIGWLRDANKNEISTIIKTIANASSDSSYMLQQHLDNMMATITDISVRRMREDFAKRLELESKRAKKKNISKVESQGRVGIRGQMMLQTLSEIVNKKSMRPETLDDLIAEELQAAKEAESTNKADIHYGKADGYSLGKVFMEKVWELAKEEGDLQTELNNAHMARGLSRGAKQDLLHTLNVSMMETRFKLMRSYPALIDLFLENVEKEREAAKEWARGIEEHKQSIRDKAEKDVEDVSGDIHQKQTPVAFAKAMNRALTSPAKTLESMLRFLGQNYINGEGELFNEFIPRQIIASTNEYIGFITDLDILNTKATEVLGKGKGKRDKTWFELKKKLDKKSDVTLSFLEEEPKEGKEVKTKTYSEFTQGNLACIYAWSKEEDGMMKLNAMGISKEDIDRIVEVLDPEVKKLVDWAQEDFLPSLRGKFNEVHMRMFGAPMDEIKNYFPLRIVGGAKDKADTIDNDSVGNINMPGTSTGSIKVRTVNTKPLNVVNANFFDILISHIREMEHWAAFAELIRDCNVLFADKDFQNKVKNMESLVYGHKHANGEKFSFYNNLRDVFRVAMGTFSSDPGELEKMAMDIARGVTTAKISGRVWTAIKQLASFPAFLSYMADEDFTKAYVHNILHPKETFDWGQENLTLLRKRYQSGDLGEILLDTSGGKSRLKSAQQFSQKIGMWPNVAIDTLTCAAGARAVYESHYAKYIRLGMSEEEAKRKATVDAEISYNRSQQSKEGAFISPIQMQKTLSTVALCVFRNANMAYSRNMIMAGYNIKYMKANKEKVLENAVKRYVDAGLMDEPTARKQAEDDYKRAMKKNVADLIINSYLMNFVWRIVGYTPYWIASLIFGGDDDKRKDLLINAVTGGMYLSPITGFLFGSLLEAAADGSGKWEDIFRPSMAVSQDIKNIFNEVRGSRWAEAINSTLNLLIQSGTGFNPETLEDVVVTFVMNHEDDLNLYDAQLWIATLLAVPESQRKQMFLDKLDEFAGDKKGKLNYKTLQSRYTDWKLIESAPKTFYLRSDEEREKAIEHYNEQFDKLYNERMKLKYGE